MTKTLKRLDLLVRDVVDPMAQENFWRLRRLFEDIQESGLTGPQGPQGIQGPAGPPAMVTSVAKVIETFSTDALTLPGHLVKVIGDTTVEKISSYDYSEIPYGVFGVGYAKTIPSEIDVLFLGVIGGYSGFTAGLPIFVGPTGLPTHTAIPPGTPGMSQYLGKAISATEFLIQIGQAFRRV